MLLSPASSVFLVDKKSIAYHIAYTSPSASSAFIHSFVLFSFVQHIRCRFCMHAKNMNVLRFAVDIHYYSDVCSSLTRSKNTERRNVYTYLLQTPQNIITYSRIHRKNMPRTHRCIVYSMYMMRIIYLLQLLSVILPKTGMSNGTNVNLLRSVIQYYFFGFSVIIRNMFYSCISSVKLVMHSSKWTE